MTELHVESKKSPVDDLAFVNKNEMFGHIDVQKFGQKLLAPLQWMHRAKGDWFNSSVPKKYSDVAIASIPWSAILQLDVELGEIVQLFSTSTRVTPEATVQTAKNELLATYSRYCLLVAGADEGQEPGASRRLSSHGFNLFECHSALKSSSDCNQQDVRDLVEKALSRFQERSALALKMFGPQDEATDSAGAPTAAVPSEPATQFSRFNVKRILTQWHSNFASVGKRSALIKATQNIPYVGVVLTLLEDLFWTAAVAGGDGTSSNFVEALQKADTPLAKDRIKIMDQICWTISLLCEDQLLPYFSSTAIGTSSGNTAGENGAQKRRKSIGNLRGLLNRLVAVFEQSVAAIQLGPKEKKLIAAGDCEIGLVFSQLCMAAQAALLDEHENDLALKSGLTEESSSTAAKSSPSRALMAEVQGLLQQIAGSLKLDFVEYRAKQDEVAAALAKEKIAAETKVKASVKLASDSTTRRAGLQRGATMLTGKTSAAEARSAMTALRGIPVLSTFMEEAPKLSDGTPDPKALSAAFSAAISEEEIAMAQEEAAILRHKADLKKLKMKQEEFDALSLKLKHTIAPDIRLLEHYDAAEDAKLKTEIACLRLDAAFKRAKEAPADSPLRKIQIPPEDISLLASKLIEDLCQYYQAEYSKMSVMSDVKTAVTAKGGLAFGDTFRMTEARNNQDVADMNVGGRCRSIVDWLRPLLDSSTTAADRSDTTGTAKGENQPQLVVEGVSGKETRDSKGGTTAAAAGGGGGGTTTTPTPGTGKKNGGAMSDVSPSTTAFFIRGQAGLGK